MSSSILVLNLTRMGDLIQMSPLILGLREKEPDCKITMLANVKFAGIVRFMKGVDELITFDVAQFGSCDGSETDALAIYNYLDDLTVKLNARKFDTIINLSHTKVSAMLTKLIGAGDIRGFSSSPRGSLLVRNPWLIYFTAFLNFRRLSRFNLVDLDSLGAGVSSGGKVRLNLAPDNESAQSAQSYFETKGVAPGDLLIGIQAGASREDRRWSPASFAVVADRLAQEKGAKIVLFGAAVEKKLGDEVETAMSEKAINLIGATDLEQLALWIKRINLLITNDTGTMHISAALGTPIVALFFVHARAEETGPYCEGAIVLQADIDCAPCSHQTVCGHLSCLKYITVNDVLTACDMALEQTETAPDDDSLFRRVKVYVSGFGEDGLIDFRPLKRERLDKLELFAYLYRPLFNETFTKWDAPETIATEGIGDWAIDDLKERFIMPDDEKTEAWIGRGVEGARRLLELAQNGERLALEVIEAGDGQSSSQLMEIGGQLTAIDYSISVLSGVYDVAQPLAHVYKRRAENFEGDDPVDLARQALKAHRWLKMSASLFINICGRALEALKNDNKKPDSYEITEGKER